MHQISILEWFLKGHVTLFWLLFFYFIYIHTTAVYIMVFIMVLFMMTMLKWPCIFICFQCSFWTSEADISKNILIQSNIDFMFLIINYKYSDFDWLDMDLWILFIDLYFIVFTLLIDWLISYTCMLGRNSNELRSFLIYLKCIQRCFCISITLYVQ